MTFEEWYKKDGHRYDYAPQAAEEAGQAAQKAVVEKPSAICPYFDNWTILDHKGAVKYKIPACICNGQASLKYPCQTCGSKNDCSFVGSDPCPRR